MKLIGLNGGMGVGKSTAISYLEEFLGYAPSLVKFAGPLYEMQEFIYGRISQVHQRPSDFTKDRKLLQWLGTDWGRETISQTVWVDIWKAETKRLLALGAVVICDDVRFDNEAELVRSLGGVVIKITSDKSSDRINTVAGIKNHASESGIKSELVDFVIDNNGSLDDYKRKLMTVYSEAGVTSVIG